MTATRLGLAFFLAAVLLAGVAAPVFALQYSPGVARGQYVKYGKFVGVGPGEETINSTSFVKQEVTAVSGTVVTLLTTGQLKDGSPTPGNGSVQVWDLAAGTLNGVDSVQGPIIAANLNQGEAIPPPNTYSVNSTETRSYLSVSRTVNILSVTIFTPEYNTTVTYVYDKASGMLMEASSETVTQGQPQPVASLYSYNVIDTNIFGPSQPTDSPTSNAPTPSPSVPEIPAWTILPLVLVAFAGVLVYVRRRQPRL